MRVILPVVVILALAGCGRSGGPAEIGPFTGAPVVLISIDTLRADHLPVYGYQGGATPTIDALGRDGIVFDEISSHIPLTLPSHASLLTGLLPFHHGVRDNIGFNLDARTRTLASRFKAAGYATGAAVSAYVLRHQTGVATGFDVFDDALQVTGMGESLSETRRDGKFTVDALSSWISAQRSDRLFAFLHLYEPHAPYTPPPEHRMANAYDGEIAYADELVGRFFDVLRARGLFDRAVIAVVSDHGEGLGDHGEAEHGVFLYREAMHVPCVIRLPHAAGAGVRVAGSAGLVDVAATLLDLAGVAQNDMDGKTLRSEMTGRRAENRTVYGESSYARFHFGWSDLTSATEGRFRYIRAPKPELYDDAADPNERQNLASARSTTTTALDAWIVRTLAGTPAREPQAVPAEVRERLKALGYASGSAPFPPEGAGTRPDPKDMIGSYDALRRADAAVAAGRTQEALTSLQAIVRDQPAMLDAWESLAKLDVQLGRTADAIAAFGKVLAVDPTKPETHLALARIYALQGDRKKARAHAELAVNRDPAGGYETLAELALDENRREDAARFASRSLEADGDRYMSAFLLGVVAQQNGDCQRAIPEFERAIESKRREPNRVVRNLHAGLADCLARTGRTNDAEREFKAELADIAASPEARIGLATLYRSESRDTEARDVLAGIVTANPQADAQSYATVVHAFDVLGDHEAARQWAAKAHQRFPADPRFR